MDRGEELLQEPAVDQQEKIFVTVRLRPLNEKEISRNDVSDWECINDATIICRNNLSVSERSMYPAAYTFDRVFSPECSTRKVYEEGAKGIALAVVSGINSSVFAYGQTSSGKTYTMIGITEYTVADIFDYTDAHKEREFVLKFSAMEIYNESVRDLLSADSTPLRLLDDPERGTVVEKLTEETLSGRNHFNELLSICEAQRQVGETSLNDTSSRSHQILRLTVESCAHDFSCTDKFSTLTATVNFVDLAGSERASQTLLAGTRLKEGCHINRSLLTLGTVIRKLSKGRNGHIPFRDSKLTRILQSTLMGSARAAIICTLSPARTHLEQSRNTLLFATCAKEVTTNAQVNVVMSDKELVKQLQRELARLENELRNAGQSYVPADTAVLLRDKNLEIEQLKEVVKELTRQRDLARSEVEDLRQVFADERLREPEPPRVRVNLGNQYPKLRVQRSWDESSVSETAITIAPHCHYSDRLSYSSSEESFLQLPDFKLKILRSNSSAKASPQLSEFAANNMLQEKEDEQVDESLEDECKVVRCIDSERSTENRYPDVNMSLSDSYRQDIDMLPPRERSSSPGSINGDDAEQNRQSKSLSSNGQDFKDFLIPSPGDQSIDLLDKDILSRSLNLSRSRSCNASLRLDSESVWFDKQEYIEKTPPLGYDEIKLFGRPGYHQRKITALRFEHDGKMLSRNRSQNSSKTAATDDLDLMNVRNGSQEYVKQFVDNAVQATEADTVCERTVKDVGLDPIESDMESPSRWPSEFRRIQREIIELWHSCNISLVHRTYFILLFKGDPQDRMYMEVELRRLTFLIQNQSQEDGQISTPTSSAKALRREREMLSQQMKRKFTEEERESLFLKWGIELQTKYRRLQLAHRLWTDTNDMNHVLESAGLVATLVDFVEPEKTFKEMFGLSFAPKLPINRKFRSFKSSVMSIL